MNLKPIAASALALSLLAGCATEATTESSASGEGMRARQAQDASAAAQRAAEAAQQAAEAAQQAAKSAEEAARRAEAAYNRSLRKGGAPAKGAQQTLPR